MSDLERRIRALEDVEAIKRLKYRYWRHLDLKQWDELADCFAADATVSYGDGRYRFAGVDAIMRFLRESLARETGSVYCSAGASSVRWPRRMVNRLPPLSSVAV